MSHTVTRVLLIILCLTYVTNGCRCSPQHPQRRFCHENAVVFVGKVTKEELPKLTESRHIKYHLKLLTSLKGINGPVGSSIVIQTQLDSSACGIRLTVGDKFLLSGMRSSKKDPIRIGSCSGFIFDATQLTFEQMIYFFSSGPDSYIRNCDCQTIIDPIHEPGRFDPRKGCKIPPEFGLCKREYGICRWKNRL
ncbi:metalloproteinase inhibitor 4-like [Mytilus trossulus]|uniref:metalloproteinase inhibitor 4-like n=1 Tax=Mytilus trossulus TaxID=6551 RepID=UPI0030078522